MQKAIVCESVSPIMLNPSFKSEMADEALYGMVVDIISFEADGWVYIKTDYNYNGYMHISHLCVDNSVLEWQNGAKYYINYSVVDVMAEPKYASYSKKLLTRGARVIKSGINDGKWEKIFLHNKEAGWIRISFASDIPEFNIRDNESSLRCNIIGTAFLYMDTQYRWGGKSPLGIDCSGLAQMAYTLSGITIPRDADLQQEYLKPISREEAKLGDLLFFPGHVALYIGEGKYIHSTGRDGKVLINSFNPIHEDYREDLDKSFTGVGTIFNLGV